MPVPSPLVDAPQPACPNCGSTFTLPRPNYCPDCGQESRLKPPTLMEFGKQFGGNYVSMEGALWRTLALLMLRPGRLTTAYLAGRRRRYVLPLRLFLTISVLVLMLVRVLASTTLTRWSRHCKGRPTSGVHMADAGPGRGQPPACG